MTVLLILEGVDRGGKSTLITALLAHHRARHPHAPPPVMRHEGPPPPGDVFTHYRAVLQDPQVLSGLALANQLVVLDRWAAGELVYGPLLRGGSRLTLREARVLQEAAQELSAVCALVQPQDPAVVEARYDATGGDELIPRDALRHIHAWYEDYAREHAWFVARGPQDAPALYAAAQHAARLFAAPTTTLRGLARGLPGRRH